MYILYNYYYKKYSDCSKLLLAISKSRVGEMAKKKRIFTERTVKIGIESTQIESNTFYFFTIIIHYARFGS